MRHPTRARDHPRDEQPARARLHRDMHLPARTARPTPRPPSGEAPIRPRETSPVCGNREQSQVICRRCTSNPAIIASEDPARDHARSRFGRPMTYRRSRSVPPFDWPAARSNPRAPTRPFDTEDRPPSPATALRIARRSCHLRRRERQRPAEFCLVITEGCHQAFLGGVGFR